MTFEFNPEFPDATNEQKWAQIRLWRNAQLKLSDWTQLPDAPVNREVWAKYRQALRDLPSTNINPDEISLPKKP